SRMPVRQLSTIHPIFSATASATRHAPRAMKKAFDLRWPVSCIRSGWPKGGEEVKKLRRADSAMAGQSIEIDSAMPDHQHISILNDVFLAFQLEKAFLSHSRITA